MVPEIKDALFWPTLEVLKGLCEFIKLSIPTMIAFALWWLAFEAIIIISGHFNPVDLAATSIVVNLIAFHSVFRVTFYVC